MTTTTPEAPKGGLNFDFEKAMEAVVANNRGFLMNLAHDKAKLERLFAFLEERRLTKAYQRWERQKLREAGFDA